MQVQDSWTRAQVARASFVKQGLIVGGGSAAEFKAFIDRDSKKWGAIIEKVGIKLD